MNWPLDNMREDFKKDAKLGHLAEVRGEGSEGFQTPKLLFVPFFMLIKAKNAQKLQFN